MAAVPAPWAALGPFAATVPLWDVIGRLGGPVAAAGASPERWMEAGLPLDAAMAMHAAEGFAHGTWAAAHDWPAGLDGLPHGPVVLAAEGDLSLLHRPCVAIVGARRCTTYGREWASRLAEAVVGAGGVVVSGLAWGIDLAAHEAAGGATVAVLGQGLQAELPAWARRAREAIVSAGGCVLTEYPPTMSARDWTFPRRNRVIAGLSRAVVVVEAARRSGARITARLGLEYGREVLAVPGPLGAEASEGCLDLLDEGATMVRGPETVLEAASLVVSDAPGGYGAGHGATRSPAAPRARTPRR